MDVQTEVHFESLHRVEVLTGPTGRRRWPDAIKGRLVAESMVPGVSVREVAERNGLAANRLSTWRGQAKRGMLVIPAMVGTNLVVPEETGCDFVSVILDEQQEAPEPPEPVSLCPIELEAGGVIMRLDAATGVAFVAELVLALKVPL